MPPVTTLTCWAQIAVLSVLSLRLLTIPRYRRPAVMESDTDFRLRIQQALKG
jgi:hypothetical protein